MKSSVEGKERELIEIRKKIMDHESKEEAQQDELARVTTELTRCVETEETLQAKLFSRDRKITHLEEKLEAERGALRRIDPSIVSDDMDKVREMLVELRGSMDTNDTQRQTLDELEKVCIHVISTFTTCTLCTCIIDNMLCTCSACIYVHAYMMYLQYMYIYYMYMYSMYMYVMYNRPYVVHVHVYVHVTCTLEIRTDTQIMGSAGVI